MQKVSFSEFESKGNKIGYTPELQSLYLSQQDMVIEDFNP